MRAPDTWSEADERRVIEELRKRRREFDATPEAKGKRPAKPPSIPKEDLKGLSGKDLLAKLGMRK